MLDSDKWSGSENPECSVVTNGPDLVRISALGSESAAAVKCSGNLVVRISALGRDKMVLVVRI